MFVKPDYWFVLDDVASHRSGDTLSWYFHSPTTLVPWEEGFRSNTAPGIVVLPAISGLRIRRGEGYAASTRSETPGNVEKINWNRFDRTTTNDSLEQFPILVMPFRTDVPSVQCTRESARRFMVKTGGVTDHLYFSSGRYDDGAVVTDAQFLWTRSSPGHRLRFGIANGTFLKYRGKEIWHSSTPSSSEGEIPH